MSDHVLLLGATGFLGGQILHHLLTRPSTNIAQITVLVSDTAKASTVEQWASRLGGNKQRPTLKVHTVSRSPIEQWYDAAKEASTQADCVVQAATSDDLQLTKAINAGIAQRRGQGKKATLVHISGVQLIESEPRGTYIETPNYDDSDVDAIQSIADSAAHRLIDLEIGRAISSGQFWGSIVCPALIWGIASGPCKRHSSMVPNMVKKSLYNRRGTYVGDGSNKWVHVHIQECADLIVLLVLDHLSNPNGEGRDHSLFGSFFFASYPSFSPSSSSSSSGGGGGKELASELVQFHDIATAIGRVLHRRGLAETEEPLSVPVPPWDTKQKGVRIEDADRSAQEGEVEKTTPNWPCRTNCRCVATRGARELGWKCGRRYDREAIEADVESALEVVLLEEQRERV